MSTPQNVVPPTVEEWHAAIEAATTVAGTKLGVTVREFAEAFGVSDSTIRRSLRKLIDDGVIVCVRGRTSKSINGKEHVRFQP